MLFGEIVICHLRRKIVRWGHSKFEHSSTWVLGLRSVELRTTFFVCVWSVKYWTPSTCEVLRMNTFHFLNLHVYNVCEYNVHICALSYVVWIFIELGLNRLNRFFEFTHWKYPWTNLCHIRMLVFCHLSHSKIRWHFFDRFEKSLILALNEQ